MSRMEWYEGRTIPNARDVHLLLFFSDGSFVRGEIIGWYLDPWGITYPIGTDLPLEYEEYCLVENVAGQMRYVFPGGNGYELTEEAAVARGIQEAKETEERREERYRRRSTKHVTLPT